MKKALFILAAFAISVLSFGQKLDPEDMESLAFRSIGPAGMSGRVTTIEFDKATQSLYVGSASGGLWRTLNNGQTWEALFQNEATSSIGAVAIDPTNPDVIWVGTGEGNPRNSQSSGAGMYKSIDGGETWMYLGLKETKNIHRVIIDPSNPSTVYVAAIGVAWGDSEERGVYKTTDGGETWNKILYNNNRTGAADLVMDPRNPNKLIVAMWEYRRWPWELKSGGEGSGIYVTFDGGKTWTKRTDEDGLPEGHLGRCGLAISASHPNIVYALVEPKGNNALYRSEDGGKNWTKVSEDDNIGNRPFYYADIYVDPERPNRIYSLWSVLTRSDDGGKTWRNIGPYNFIHPDHHAFWMNPDNPDHIIDGNDGGMNISYDGGETWRFIENLPLAQFYHINVDNQIPYNVMGGMQDNGSWIGPAYTWRAGGIRNDLWEELYFGDGFDVMEHPSDVNTVYAMSQEGYVGRIDMNTGHAKLIRPVHPEGEELRFNWNAAIAQDPFDPATIYFGSQYVHKSTNQGDSWTIISPDLSTNDPEHQKASESGGLTYDVTGAENYTTILAIAPSPAQQGVIWVGTDDGNLQVTQDGGETWTNVASKLKGVPEGAWIPQIQVSKTNAGEALVVVNDYRRNNWEPYLFHTTNYGKSFTRLVDGEDVDGYVLSALRDPEEENLMFVGTENGLYYSLDAGENWTKWADDLPTVPVADMAIQEREGDLVLGTFGRAAWVLDDIRPLRAIAANMAIADTEPLTAFDAPDAYDVVRRQALGVRFAGSAVYEGENRGGGARFSYWVNVDTANAVFKDNERISWDIMNASGDTIRHIERKYEDGLNRVAWDMQEKGVRFPSMSEPRKDQLHSDPGGVSVLPGTYTIHLRIGDLHDQTQITVHHDPRIRINRAELEENHAYQAELLPLVESISNVATNLRRAKKSIELIESMIAIEDLPKGDTTWKPVQEQLKAMKDSIEVIRKSIFGSENIEGYYSEPETWISMMGLFGYYNYTNMGAVSGNLRDLENQFKERTNAVLEKSNKFFENDWAPFVEMMKTQEYNLFPELEEM